MPHTYSVFLKPKKSSSGLRMINLACGTRTNSNWTNLDFSPYTRLAKRLWLAKFLHSIRIVSDTRYERLKKLDPEIVHYNLLRSVPFANDSFDVVYHSHFLEHLDRHIAPMFLSECKRILKAGGIMRVVLPDLNMLINRYTDSFARLEKSEQKAGNLHESVIHDIFDQMVRTVPTGTAHQNRILCTIERFIRGNAKSVGELHRWMYDRFTLRKLLIDCDFTNVKEVNANTSAINSWSSYGLDTAPDGTPHHPDSLYMEAQK